MIRLQQERNSSKMVHQEDYIVLNNFSGNVESFKINDLSVYLHKLYK